MSVHADQTIGGGLGTAEAEAPAVLCAPLGAADAAVGTSATAPLRTIATPVALAKIFRLFTRLLSAFASVTRYAPLFLRLLWILCWPRGRVNPQ